MKHILVFGDSNTWGYDHTTYDAATGTAQRLAWQDRWTGRAQALLGDGYRIIENALNGRTCVQDDPYFPHRKGITSLQVALEAHAPLDLVVLHLGCNELKHMFQLSAGMIAFGAEQLAQAAQTPCYGYPAPRVLLIAPAPTHPDIHRMIFGFNFGPEAYAKSCALGAAYRAVAERNGCGFLDCADLAFALNTLDGLHYAQADHAKLAVAAAEKIKAMLAA